MGRLGSRSTLAWLSIGVLLLAGLSLASAQVARTISVSECKGASYYDPGKKNLCGAASVALKPIKIETVQDGRGLLQFPNQSKVTVYGKSVFTVDKYDDKTGLAATLKSGRIKYASLKKTGTYDAIAGKEVKLAHIGTTFIFSVGAQAGAKPKAAKPTLVWKQADTKKLKARDVPNVKNMLPELCSAACAPSPWKGGTWKGTVTVKNLKIRSDLQCACLGDPSDRDGDSIADAQDACPKQGGTPSPNRALNGCPPVVERVVLLPDADGKVGTVEIQKLETGEVLAKLDKAYESAGVTASGEVVEPTVLETKESVAAAVPEPPPATQPIQPAQPTQTTQSAPAEVPDPMVWCKDRAPRNCCTTPTCDGRSCCWVFVGDDFCRADLSWSTAQCFLMDAEGYGGGGGGDGSHFVWRSSADSGHQTWSELGCTKKNDCEVTCSSGNSSSSLRCPEEDSQPTDPPATGTPPSYPGYPPATTP